MLHKLANSTLSFFLMTVVLNGFQTRVIAHRGASSVAPENTMAAFKKAIEFDADYFELDVQSSSDDSLVIMHDETIDRTTNGSGNVYSLSYTDLRAMDAGTWFDQEFSGEKIPTLAEALDLALNAAYDVGVVIEIKANNPTIVDKTVAEVVKRNMQDRVIISSFTFDQIARVKTLDSSIPVQLFGTIAETHVQQIAGIGGEWVGTDGAITQSFLDMCHGKDVLVNKWTVNSSAEMITLLQLGVDAMTTNYPQTFRLLTDDTPPSDVALKTAITHVTDVILTWSAAEDPESGIGGYEIYRDTTPNAAILLATVGDTTSFIDETRKEATTLYYRIKAKNGAGLTSVNFSDELSVTTDFDTQTSTITYVSSLGQADGVIIGFDERLDKSRSETASAYQINQNVEVKQARLSIDSTCVMLTTSDLMEAQDYLLSISGIADIAKTPNVITQPIESAFKHMHWPSQTAAVWTLDDGEGSIIRDVSGNGNDGESYNEVGWASGYTGNGLMFDGIDDWVKIPRSNSLDIAGDAVSISLWTKLDLLPNELPGAFGPIYDSDSDNYVIYEDKNNNELRFKVTTTGAAERPGIPAVKLRKDEWLHIVGVYDGSHARIYLNGELQDSHSLSGNVRPGQIAILGQSAGSYFKGYIDNIQIYSRVLLLEEIQMLHSGQKQLTAIAGKFELPNGFALYQNYPNPFNPTTTISYSIAASCVVRLNLYDILGRKVRSIVNHYQPAGPYTVVIDASELPAGMYCYRLEAGSFVAVKKLLLAK